MSEQDGTMAVPLPDPQGPTESSTESIVELLRKVGAPIIPIDELVEFMAGEDRVLGPAEFNTPGSPAEIQQMTTREIIEFLWAIIDDIDTYSDMAKGDDKFYRNRAQRRQKDRWKTGITTDGYTLVIPGLRPSESEGEE